METSPSSPTPIAEAFEPTPVSEPEVASEFSPAEVTDLPDPDPIPILNHIRPSIWDWFFLLIYFF